jgi:hypothetical protein
MSERHEPPADHELDDRLRELRSREGELRGRL